MESNIILKAQIIEYNNQSKTGRPRGNTIIYRVVKIDNKDYYAEELATVRILPIFDNSISYKLTLESTYEIYHISNVMTGTFFAPCPLKKEFPLRKITINIDALEKNDIVIPTQSEISEYIETKKNDPEWQLKMQHYEASNDYWNLLKKIKEKINQQKTVDYRFSSGYHHNQTDVFFRRSDKMSNRIQNEATDTELQQESQILPIDLRDVSNFGYDLSTRNDLCNLIGREAEIKSIIKRAFIRNKSLLLVGPSGSGKTSIVEQLALKIRNQDDKWLKDKMIFSLYPGAFNEGTKYRGTFEEKVKEFLNFCKKYKGRLIIFIDEIHTLYGQGRSEDSAIDAMNILKPYIEKKDITIIGATTIDEYLEFMANDPAFLRRFVKVEVPVPDKELNIQILISYIRQLEQEDNIKLDLTYEQIVSLVDYIIDITDKKNQNKIANIAIENPTISKNIIEEAFTEAIYNEANVVTIEDICFAIIHCSQLSPTFRKTKAQELKEKLLSNSIKPSNYKKILTLNPTSSKKEQ